MFGEVRLLWFVGLGFALYGWGGSIVLLLFAVCYLSFTWGLVGLVWFGLDYCFRGVSDIC